MKWEGPGLLFRSSTVESSIKLTLEFKAFFLEIVSSKEDHGLQKENIQNVQDSILFNDILHQIDEQIVYLKKTVKEITTEILNGEFLKRWLEDEKIAVVFIFWKQASPQQKIIHSLHMLTEYADKQQNILIIASLQLREIGLLQELKKIVSPNLFLSYGYLQKRAQLIHPLPFLYRVLYKELKKQFFNCSIANKILLPDVSAEIKGYKDFLFCIHHKINPIMDFKQKGARLFGIWMNDSKMTLTERLSILGIRKILIQQARNYLYEPNNQSLWKRVERDLTYILKEIWNAGILKGDTPQQAFSIVCDERNNSISEQDSYLNISVGVAVAQPAQFFEINLNHVVEVLPG